MRRVPLDELDDPSPPPLKLIRFCGAEGCRRVARTRGRHCKPCHTAAVRRWREAHRTELAVRRRDAAANRDADTRARDVARATLAMALRRKKITRGRCRVCDGRDVIAIIADPTAPLEAEWICRADRQAEIERRQADNARRTAATAQSNWERDRAEALAAIALLPPAIQAKLAAIAVRGPGGMRLSPEAPFYVIQLVRAYKAWLSKPLP